MYGRHVNRSEVRSEVADAGMISRITRDDLESLPAE
jgi:hypothetical protein